MSSASEMRALAALALLLVLASCEGRRESAAFAEARVPATNVPVGPFPGIEEHDVSTVRNPYEKNVDAVQRGRLFFLQYNCAGCHGDHGGGGMGPSLRDEEWLYGGTDAQIAKSIVEGRNFGMPAWGKMLTEEQVWQITAYIKTMRTPQEADPPTP